MTLLVWWKPYYWDIMIHTVTSVSLTYTHFNITLGPLFCMTSKLTPIETNKNNLFTSLSPKTHWWCWLRMVFTVTYKYFSERKTKQKNLQLRDKCLWYKKKCFPRAPEMKRCSNTYFKYLWLVLFYVCVCVFCCCFLPNHFQDLHPTYVVEWSLSRDDQSPTGVGGQSGQRSSLVHPPTSAGLVGAMLMQELTEANLVLEKRRKG